MNKPFTHLAVFVFSVVSLVQLLRLLFGWEVVVQGHTVPVWLSAVGFVVAGGLAVTVWREMPRRPR